MVMGSPGLCLDSSNEVITYRVENNSRAGHGDRDTQFSNCFPDWILQQRYLLFMLLKGVYDVPARSIMSSADSWNSFLEIISFP